MVLQLFLVALLAAAAQDSPPPFATAPVTVVVLDDVGWELLEEAPTPHLDALAARGVTFTRAWSYPACSTARAALLSGRHPWRTGVGAVVRGQAGERGLALEETTFAELLPERAEAFGKWHIGTGATNPNDQGFAHYAGCLGNLNGPGGRGYTRWARTVDGETSRATEWATHVTTDDARASDAPLRYVAYHAVHRPLELPPGAAPVPTRPNGKPEERPTVIAMLVDLDAQLGRLLEGYGGYVFVLADNGGETAFGGLKGQVDERGVRVPFFVAGPGIAPAVRDDPIGVVDMFATLAEMRGVAIPEGVAEDSISFLPVLRGEPGRREVVFTERFADLGLDHERAAATRTHRLTIDAAGHETLARYPDGRVVPPPWDGADATAAATLRAALPPPPVELRIEGARVPIAAATIDAVENANTRYLVTVEAEGARLEPGSLDAELRLAGRPVDVTGASTDPARGRTTFISYLDRSAARRAGRALGISPAHRVHPGHTLEVRVVAGENPEHEHPLRFVIENAGHVPITFLDGGRNRNERGRDDRFTFEVTLDGTTLEATELHTYGGLGVHRTLPPGRVWTFELDAADWFELPGSGHLAGTVRYEMEIVGREGASDRPGRHWDETLEATFEVDLRAPR